jgi:hypothetical protein
VDAARVVLVHRRGAGDGACSHKHTLQTRRFYGTSAEVTRATLHPTYRHRPPMVQRGWPNLLPERYCCCGF